MRAPLLLLFAVVLVLTPHSPANDEAKPLPSKDIAAKLDEALARKKNAVIPVDLVIGQPLKLPLKQLPLRIGIDQRRLLAYSINKDKVLRLDGRSPGKARVTLFYGDPQKPDAQFALTLAVRVQKKAS